MISSYSIISYETLHPGDILGQVDNFSIIWCLCINPFGELAVTSILIASKSLAFCKIYVANRRSFLEPSKFIIVHDLRWEHSRTEIGHFDSFNKLELHCQKTRHIPSRLYWNLVPTRGTSAIFSPNILKNEMPSYGNLKCNHRIMHNLLFDLILSSSRSYTHLTVATLINSSFLSRSTV